MVLTWDSTIREELDMVEQEMRDRVFSEQSLLTEISLYVIGSGGKRIRPAIALLSFKANGGKDPAKVIKIASAFEMIHAATLIHDDINDAGEFRRGREAAYKRFGTQRALIAGDFLFVKSFKLGGTFDEKIVDMIADACTSIAESEMLQIIHEQDAETSLKDYLKIIEGKTAKFMEASAMIGAYLAGADSERMALMGRYGLNIGIAFQIRDDILDVVGNQATLGKPRGVDFMDGKPNLVLLYAMADEKVGKDLKALFLKKGKTKDDLERAMALVSMTDAVARARMMVADYTSKAKDAVIEMGTASSYTRSMEMLADSLEERNI
ncbi:MAG: polyprenyl synthetase family protein [Methanomassiliicoccales archaeon]|nr:MAG: polyprenyl synthetase family protein [Methanomassiliicoccales archaeon]